MLRGDCRAAAISRAAAAGGADKKSRGKRRAPIGAAVTVAWLFLGPNGSSALWLGAIGTRDTIDAHARVYTLCVGRDLTSRIVSVAGFSWGSTVMTRVGCETGYLVFG